MGISSLRKNEFLLEQIFSIKSRFIYASGFIALGSKQKVTEVLPLCGNGGKKNIKVNPYMLIIEHYLIALDMSELVLMWVLTLKAPIMTAADDIHKYFFIVFQTK